MTVTWRPARSCLYVPASNEKALNKASVLGPDTFFFDLEDAVLPEQKSASRTALATVLTAHDYAPRRVFIRVNGLDTSWGMDDLKMAIAARPDGIVVPKINCGDDITRVNQALDDLGADPNLAVWAMIETPLAILNLKEIAQNGQTTRLSGLVMGTNDLAKECRATPTLDRMSLLPYLALTLAAARSFDLVAIDGVFNNITYGNGLLAECVQGKALGFDGKSLIHPRQIDICHEVFSPSKEELAQARTIVAAFDDPANKGKGVLNINGEMTERLHLEQAQRLIKFDQDIQAR